MRFYNTLFTNVEDADGAAIALIGGGGKTTLLHTLGAEFSEYYPRVLLSSLTKSAVSIDHPAKLLENDLQDQFEGVFSHSNPLLVLGKALSDQKLSGLRNRELSSLIQGVDVCVFECDGARNLPLKAHNQSDQIVPDFSTHLLVVLGAEVSGTSLNDGHVHRPGLFRQLWGLDRNQHITPEQIARTVTSKKGYFSKVLHEIKCAFFVNKADQHYSKAVEIAEAISNVSEYDVFFGSLTDSWIKKCH
jgi:probable selenium-dependent hydroxylase accessory protein YqeC